MRRYEVLALGIVVAVVSATGLGLVHDWHASAMAWAIASLGWAFAFAVERTIHAKRIRILNAELARERAERQS